MVTSLLVFQDITSMEGNGADQKLLLPLHQRDHEDEPERSRWIGKQIVKDTLM